MIFITISFLVIAALGTPNEAENARLLQTNAALRQALQELEVGVDEEQVGNGGGCDNQEAKSCTGTKLKLTDFTREHMNGGAAYSGENWCVKQCEYYGLNGCCQFDSDSGECWFSRDGKVRDDDFSKDVLVSELGTWPMEWETVYNRHSGMCTWSGAHEMIAHARKTACKWNGADKDGRKQKSGTSTESSCKSFCIDNNDCVFAEFKSGVCRIYKTCTRISAIDDNDNGYKIWQKVRSDAPTTWVDDRWGGYDCDARCAHNKYWIGDGSCDAYMCGGCDFWFKDGKLDGGDCEGW